MSQDWRQEQVNPKTASSEMGPMLRATHCHSFSTNRWQLEDSRIHQTLSQNNTES